MAKKKKEETEDEGGLGLDDAFADDDDVDYAPAKPKKPKKKKSKKKEEVEGLSGSLDDDDEIEMKGKDISKIKKGDKMRVDGVEMEVDAHYVLIDHGKGVEEMAIEMFDPKTDKDYQLRYFPKRVKESAEFFELDEIVYNRKNVKKIEW